MRHLLFCFALSIIPAVTPAAPLRVLIDPGHGGKDQGAVRGEVAESQIVLEVSKWLHRRLQGDRRFRSSLTRESDRFISLGERARLAKSKQAEIFVSVHVNANPDPRARGAEFYFQNQLPPDEESMRMAHMENLGESHEAKLTYPFLDGASYPQEVTSILTDLLDNHRILQSSQLSKSLKTAWTGSQKSRANSVLQAPFYVLSEIKIPSALVELGFLTNPQDLESLTQPRVHKQMAEDLYKGLVKYKESLDKR